MDMSRLNHTRRAFPGPWSLSALLAGAALVGLLQGADNPAPEKTADSQNSKPAEVKSARDQHGDSLPAGATARGGTVRFRHGSTAIAYSPDGKLLASGGHDNTIRLFDAASGREVRRLAGHQPRTYRPEPGPRSALLDTLLSTTGNGFVCSVAFSPDGKTLASGGWDDCIRLWDVATGKEVRKIDAHKAMVTHVAFSPDGRLLASRGGLDGAARVWDPTTGVQLHRFTGLSLINPWRFNHDSALAFAPDSKTLAVTARKAIVIYDLATGAETKRIAAHVYGICLAYSPDGKLLASGGVDEGHDQYSLRLWDVPSGKEVRACTLPKMEPPTYIAFPPGRSDRLAAVVAEDVMHVFDVSTGKSIANLGHYWPSRICFTPDGKALASAGSGPVIRHWDPATGKELFTDFAGHQASANGVALSADGKLAASAGETVRHWDPATGKPLRSIAVHGGAASVAFSPDGKALASAGRDRVVHLWDVKTGQSLKEFKGHNNPLCAVAFSSDGKHLASGDVQSTIRIWDTESGKEQCVIDNKSGTEALSLAFSPDGKTLACAGAWNDSSFLPRIGSVVKFGNKEIKIDGPISIQGVEMTRKEGYFVLLWDAASGKEVRRFGGLKDKVRSVAFAPDGRMVAAASRDGKVCLWDADTGKVRLFIVAHPGHGDLGFAASPSVAFAPDGRKLISAAGDHTLRVWDAATGQELRQYRSPEGAFTSLGCARDGKTVITGSSDGQVLLWDITLPVPEAQPREHVITIQ
jgi:WD40 repeat protein